MSWLGVPPQRSEPWAGSASWVGVPRLGGLRITQQPEERMFQKVPDLSQPGTRGCLGLGGGLCKMVLIKQPVSCLRSPSAPRWSQCERHLLSTYCVRRPVPDGAITTSNRTATRSHGVTHLSQAPDHSGPGGPTTDLASAPVWPEASDGLKLMRFSDPREAAAAPHSQIRSTCSRGHTLCSRWAERHWWASLPPAPTLPPGQGGQQPGFQTLPQLPACALWLGLSFLVCEMGAVSAHAPDRTAKQWLF